MIVPKPLVRAIDLKFGDLVVFDLLEEDKLGLQQYQKWVKRKRRQPPKSV